MDEKHIKESNGDQQNVTKKVSKKLRTAKRTLTESFKSSAILKQKYREKLKHNRSKDKRANLKLPAATSHENLSKDDSTTSNHKESVSVETRLEDAGKEVSSAILYFDVIVKKKIADQYSGSATKVFESTQKLIEKLDKASRNDQSVVLSSCRSNVVQCLAKLIHWSDVMLLDDTPLLEEIDINETILSLKKGTEEFVSETIQRIKTQEPKPSAEPKTFNVERSQSTENVSYAHTHEVPTHNSTPPLPPKKRNSVQKPTAFVQPNNHTVDYSPSNSVYLDNMILPDTLPRHFSGIYNDDNRVSYCSTISSSDACEENHHSSMVDVGNLLDHHLPSPRCSTGGGEYESDYEDLHMKVTPQDKIRDQSDPMLRNILPIRLSLTSLHGHDSDGSWSSLNPASSEEIIDGHPENDILSNDLSDHPPPLPVKQSHLAMSKMNVDNQSYDYLDTWSLQEDEPPPLPPKQTKIQAYMHFMDSGGSQPPPLELFAKQTTQRYTQRIPSQHTSSYYSSYYSSSMSNRDSISSITSTLSEQSLASNPAHPPALPPKMKRNSMESALMMRSQRTNSLSSASSGVSSDNKDAPPLPTKGMILPSKNSINTIKTNKKSNKAKEEIKNKELSELVDPGDLFDKTDVSDYLNYKRSDGKSGVEVEAGCVSALIVNASESSGKDLMFYEAFLATYRTYISPHELLEKLLERYFAFGRKAEEVNAERQTNIRTQQNSFFLMLRVVDELCKIDIIDNTLFMLMKLVFKLLCSKQLQWAKLMRDRVLTKFKSRPRKNTNSHQQPILTVTLQKVDHSILDFSSAKVAEQMTLLDLELFKNIETPEVLQWASEQSEDKCPNLTAFTEHFNNISYWTRTIILMNSKDQDREKLLTKFIRVMRHLRKMNNFNSYLAILSALDSAPIRRLEWQKQTTEGLREYCQLIDSSSSFRTYREALSEASVPCIPYLGLILQDLTFIHLGNKDESHPGVINFSKRWQYFHILDNMRRFKLSEYTFTKEPTILRFFGDFRDFKEEEELWEKSLEIKPRVQRRRHPPQQDSISEIATSPTVTAEL